MTDDVRECLEILDKAVEFEETGMASTSSTPRRGRASWSGTSSARWPRMRSSTRPTCSGSRPSCWRTTTPTTCSPGRRPTASRRGQVFESALENASDPYQAEAAELEIIQGAMDVERKGYVMYSNAVKTVQSERARDIFRHLAEEEQRHYSLLKNTYDFLADPEGWHGFDESPMLDGG